MKEEKKITFCVGCNFAINENKHILNTIHGPMHRYCGRTWFKIDAIYSLGDKLPEKKSISDQFIERLQTNGNWEGFARSILGWISDEVLLEFDEWQSEKEFDR